MSRPYDHRDMRKDDRVAELEAQLQEAREKLAVAEAKIETLIAVLKESGSGSSIGYD